MNLLASRAQLRASFLRWALFTVPACVLLGFLSGQFSGSGADDYWFAELTKPGIFPPPMWFGIVWTVLYVLMGVALALVCAAWGARGRGIAIALFALQFCVNLAWSPVFFALHEIRAALVVIGILDVLVIATIFAFWKVRKTAAMLLLPYLVWILFATLLNYQFLVLNPDADGVEPSNAVQRIEL
ncbi:putative membrane protein YtaB [Alteripontixanthobacter maritimus]|uniref:Putative membrane protein YtaB n=1 Tax=Alteripontixanthobacter maritimus TaxID=2161824 RepID=A0A369Q3J6_9SPHN|nr:TspO/MBR family protein [Alteripontixanthobacter maritimus]RDC59463.1 putative membrane protein YtaB [Alteripontixanthobacter maritimus]